MLSPVLKCVGPGAPSGRGELAVKAQLPLVVMEVDGLAGTGGLAGGIKDLHDDDIGVEGAQVALGGDLAGEHGGEIRE